MKQQCLDEWANGNFEDRDLNLKAIGKVQMLVDIINMDYEEANGE